MELDQTSIIVLCVIGFIIWLWILAEIIKWSVKQALRSQDFYLQKQNRLLIKLLEKNGVSKKELVDIFNQTEEQFWASIAEKQNSNSNV